MAMLNGTFDAANVEPSVPFTALPPGDYPAQIVASSMETTSSGTGRYLKLEIEVADGEQAGRKIFDRLNLENPNTQAVEIAQRTLSAICRAIGVMTVSDSEQLHFKKMSVKIATVPRKDRQGNVVPGEFSNEVKGYRAVANAPAGGPAAPAQKSGFTPGAAAGGGGSAAPWKRQA